MNIGEIISEADARVDNTFSSAQKVSWLNEVNNEFFDVVKIPLASNFVSIANTATYNLAGQGIRAKNIGKVELGTAKYRSFLYDDAAPGRNRFVFNDQTSVLTLTPAPVLNSLTGNVQYFQAPQTTFLTSNLVAVPDAPAEYHWIYILGLCERIAKTMDDIVRGNNFANDYRGNLVIAQQNFQRGAAS